MYKENKNKKKTTKMVRAAGFEPRSPAWQLATLTTEPRRHSTAVVYCTYLTHLRTLQQYQRMSGYLYRVKVNK